MVFNLSDLYSVEYCTKNYLRLSSSKIVSMESPGPTNEILSEHRPKALPGMLNVLTILTFIGCGIAYLSTCYSYIAGDDPEKQIEKLHEAREKAGDGFWAKMIDS